MITEFIVMFTFVGLLFLSSMFIGFIVELVINTTLDKQNRHKPMATKVVSK